MSEKSTNKIIQRQADIFIPRVLYANCKRP